MNIDDKLNEIKARVEAATPGPWRIHQPGPGPLGGCWALEAGPETWEGTIRIGCLCTAKDNDKKFIASARLDVPKLVAALEKIIDQLEANSARWKERECLCDPKRLGTRCHRCHCLTTNRDALAEIERLLQ